jgi:hypothetical protein
MGHERDCSIERALRSKGVATTETKESYKIKVSRDETGDGEVVNKPENGNQSDAKTASVHDILNADDDVVSMLEGKKGQCACPGKVEIAHGDGVGAVNTSGERQRSENKPGGGGDKPRQSHLGVPGGSSQPGSPQIWAAYIHVGLSAGGFGGCRSRRGGVHVEHGWRRCR